MSDRTPAGDKGTADRIAADDGGYWVRLVTKQAHRREGVCMGNCLDSQGYGQHLAGNEDMLDDGLWSLRKADGVSHLLVELNDLCAPDERTARVENARGPKNSQPSGWSIRQLRHLVAAFNAAGSTFQIPVDVALVGEDGRTWRPDKAPQALKDAIAAKQREGEAAAAEKARARGDTDYLVRNDPYVRAALNAAYRGIVGDGPINPSSEARSITAAIQNGIVTRSEVYEEFDTGRMIERVKLILEGNSERPPRQEDVLTPEDGGTYTFRQTGCDGSIHTVTGVLLLGSVQTVSGLGTSALELRMAKRHPPGMRAFGAEMRAGARSGIEVDMLGAPVAYHIPERWGETRHSPGIITP
ncbi:hypothetical protein ACLBXJ_15535 [Methylobacterium mesophilicum]